MKFLKFQSTLPLRGATAHDIADDVARLISIHAPLAGSDGLIQLVRMLPANFNPRSPCGERPALLLEVMATSRFQSTLPLRGATRTEWLS